MTTAKILFILKEGTEYGTAEYGSNITNNGLYNSAKFVVEMLRKQGVVANLVQVADSDGIDAQIKKFKPGIVVIEALWVEPKNLKVLQSLNPEVRFLIRIHSETAFLVQEMIAVAWIAEYLAMGVSVGFNSYRTAQVLSNLYPSSPVLFIPDYFQVTDGVPDASVVSGGIQIGCFGALRLMKNQLNQAIAAIQFGREINTPINFHINTSFHGDNNGAAILANLRALFADTENTLVEHVWHTEEDFTALLLQMDVAMQVSFSESFNLVAAEAANLRIPVVVSSEIRWAGPHAKAHPTDVVEITARLHKVFKNANLVHANVSGLREYSDISRAVWLDFVCR